MAKNKLYVTLMLDETGSMEGVKEETIDGYNSYIDGLKKAAKDDGTKIRFSLVKWDSAHVDKVHVGEKIKNVPHLNGDTYQPGQLTPLYDACMKGIIATESAVKEGENVVFVIQTDGYENASHEYTLDDLTKKIKEKTKEGWQFLYLGCNADEWGQKRHYGVAQSMGIGARNTAGYHPSSARATMDSLVSNSTAAAVGESASFTADQKAMYGDKVDTTAKRRKPDEDTVESGFSL